MDTLIFLNLLICLFAYLTSFTLIIQISSTTSLDTQSVQRCQPNTAKIVHEFGNESYSL